MKNILTKRVEVDDKKLVEQVQSGHKLAFDSLVHQYQPKVAKLLRHFTSDPHEILDITQEVFLKAFNAIGNFRFESTFYTWLYRIAVNTAKTHQKDRWKRQEELLDPLSPETGESIGIGGEASTPEDQLLENERTKLAMAALENLSADLKMALYLREMEGLDYKAIAEVMECPVGTVRSRLSRARKRVIQNKI